MATSTVVTESRKITQTTTTVSTVGGYKRTEVHTTLSTGANPVSSNFRTPMATFPRLTEGRASYHGSSYTSLTPYRSAFNNAPMAAYRSFNSNTRLAPPETQPIEKKSKSLLSIFKSNDKEKDDKTDKKAKEKDKIKKDKEKKAKKEKEKEKDAKNNKIVSVTDTRLVMPSPILNNSSNSLYSRRYFNPDDMDKKLTIKVVKGKQFLPTEEDKVPTYSTKNKYNRGKVLLINNINFPKDKYRAGAHVDHENISKLFKGMGFAIKGHYNKNEKDMRKVITDYCKDSSLKNADLNVTVIMSHGNAIDGRTYIETIDGHEIPIEWIVNEFSNFNCTYLANKPKIFIFQCCRGAGRDVVQTDATPFQAPRTNADMLLAYATVPGFVSHRDPKLGTWYIQAICKIFMEHAHDTDVENLLKIVDANLEKNYQFHRQTSSYENRGFKRCYLNPIP